MQYPNDPTALPIRTAVQDASRAGAAQFESGPESRCAAFEDAREAACSDPDLGRLWLNLFDDADP
ncbi:hypothetical protein HUK65_14530 [Rhodobacteraceae bacterium 2376]|uniref:Uncharacterized protein n=1 Tax=Rhabdonatronobacter sediminivivens TaxID=2743469 RepID=A0A7Z0I1J4_9RHOB|nr:hypothetical protein [Rhabdonatronobacter sediminivivens]NYS26208.1 hypothetical protein [Rhabdonatronobacter sediminivivens]